VDSPLVRGGLTIVAGVLTGNVLGFIRVAVIAYLLGTRSHADSLAVAMGPLDTVNAVLLNSIVFAFVPMLTAANGEDRTALFLKLTRCFLWVFSERSGSSFREIQRDFRSWRAWRQFLLHPRA
jgi:peptidoglycan biosynthesis protein MviN/MurJ (putative lipid II flippase)